MTVNTVSNRINFVADGSTTVWNVPFPMVDPGFVDVFITNPQGITIKIPVNLYQVILNPKIDPNPTSIGGQVLFPISGTPLAVGNILSVIRNLPAVQETSLGNQSIIYPAVVEAQLDYLTMLDQGGVSENDRAFRVGPSDPSPTPVPTVAVRRNQAAFFDTNGELTPGQVPGGTVFISAVMQPVVGAATLQSAQTLMGFGPDGYQAIDGSKTLVTAAYSVTQFDARSTLILKGNAYYTVSLGTPASYLKSFQVLMFNADTRGKLLSIPGRPNFILWPGQWVLVTPDAAGTAWMSTTPGRWHPDAAVNFWVHATQGSDANDGLAQGTGAFQTIQQAVNVVQMLVDGKFTINVQDGTHNVGIGVIASLPVLGADGYSIVGNIPNPHGVNIVVANGGTAFLARDNSVITVQGFNMFCNAGNDANGIAAQSGGVINCANFIMGNLGLAGTGIFATSNGTLNITGPYSVEGGANQAVHCGSSAAGFISYLPGTVTILGGSTYIYWFHGNNIGTLHCGGQTPAFSGGALITAQQYSISNNSVFITNGSTPPGNVAGTTATGGIWS